MILGIILGILYCDTGFEHLHKASPLFQKYFKGFL